MKTLYMKAAALLLFTTLLGCNEQEEVVPSQDLLGQESSQEISSGVNEVKYVYKGQTSNIKYKREGGANVPLEGRDNARIMAAFEVPTLATYVDLSDPSTVYLFDTSAELDSYLKKSKRFISGGEDGKASSGRLSAVKTANASYGYPQSQVKNSVYAYADKDLGGEYYSLGREMDWVAPLVSYNNLPYHGWNDRISSIFFDMRHSGTTGVLIQAFEDSNFGGRSISFACDGGKTRTVGNLQDNSLGGLFSGNWNDEISSIKRSNYTLY